MWGKGKQNAAVTCDTDGHRSVEIDDNGQPGQVFWCERCHSVRRVLFDNAKQLVRIIELKPATEVRPEGGASEG